MGDGMFLRSPEEPFDDLYLCFCGYEKCESLHSWGPGIRPTCVIHFVLKGKGVLKLGGESFTPGAGDGFLIPPDELVYYQADVHDPWEYLWIGFNGTSSANLLHCLGLAKHRPVFHCSDMTAIRSVMDEMFRYPVHSPVSTLYLQSLLFRLFAVLVEQISLPVHGSTRSGNAYVRSAMQYIAHNYADNIHVSDLAAYAGITRNYLYSLFVRETGMSPQEYLQAFRLATASQMLSDSDYPVDSIAYSCGYQDPMVFIKAFRRKYGITPLQYRKQDRKAARQPVLQEDHKQPGGI